MKKTLIALAAALAAALVAATAQAQVTVTGQLHTMFHLSLQNGSSRHAQAFEVTEPQRHFSFLHSQSFFSVNAEFEGASGFLSFAGDGGWEAGVWGRVGAAEFGMGYGELPWARPSGISFAGDYNTGAGAANSLASAHFMGRFAVAPGMSVYAGLAEGGRIDGAILSGENRWSHPIPGFFAGFDMEGNGFEAGLAYAFLHHSHALDGENVFSWMLAVSGRLLEAGPAGVVALNVALYEDPYFGFFAVADEDSPFWHAARHNRFSLLVLEAMVEARFPLAFGEAALSYGIVTNFESESDAFGMQAAAQVTVPFGNGFSLIPGVRFRFDNDHAGNSRHVADIGLHARFNF